MACFNIFDIILHRVCRMQHESVTSSTYPGSCKTCFSGKPVFGGKVLLIFLIPELSSFNWFGSKNEQFSQFAHIFHRGQTCLASPTPLTLKFCYQIDQIQAKYELSDSGE